MLGDTLVISWNSVNKTLVKVNQDAYASNYRLDDIATTGYVFDASIKHTLPDSKTLIGETHLIRLDASLFTAGKYVQKTSAWVAIQNMDGPQDKTATGYAVAALAAYAAVGATVQKILGRES